MKKPIFVATAAVVAMAALGFAAFRCLTVRTANSAAVRIFLPEGTSYAALCDTLQCRRIVAAPDGISCFHLKAAALGLTSRTTCGSYIVQPGMPELALVRKLRNRQQDPVRLTIGKFRLPRDLDSFLCHHLMHQDFQIPLDSLYLIRPDTYEFYWTVSPRQFMQRMHTEFDRFWSSVASAPASPYLDKLTLSAPEVIALAAIVEEETNNDAEKPLIASVYLNRLQRHIPLQADPTVKYALQDFSLRRILNRHLAAESPFNTYLHTGLPPAPICLPSAASVKAVLNAPQTPYLYFCASPDFDGTHRFAQNLAQHNRNAAAFHKALNQRQIK